MFNVQCRYAEAAVLKCHTFASLFKAVIMDTIFWVSGIALAHIPDTLAIAVSLALLKRLNSKPR